MSNAKEVTTSSGLKYEILKEGAGVEAKQRDTVKMHYTGWLAKNDGSKGKKFDSSVDRKQPFSFVLGTGYVIKGWDEGVEGMKIGEQRRLIIPSHLGYDKGVPSAGIPPRATLIFDVELLGVER